jgi:hypothetical protein
MSICAVIDLNTNQQINTIMASPTDLPPDGCKLVEIPEGYFWDGQQVSLIPIPDPIPEEPPVEPPVDGAPV